tara:strand:- start:48 stop:449 length:402 start_codon:yes stop_codon:yes gene_type:complete
MNTIQKFCFILGIASLAVFYIAIAATPIYNFNSFYEMFRIGSTDHTNHIGIIAFFNMVCSVMGFFLFNDKPLFNWTAINWSEVKGTIFDYFMVLIGIGFALGGFLSFGSGISLLAFFLAFFILYKTNRNFKNN